MKKYILKIFLIIILFFLICGLENKTYARLVDKDSNEWTLINVRYEMTEDFTDSSILTDKKSTVLDLINKYSSKEYTAWDAKNIKEEERNPITNPLIIHTKVKISRSN